ncbi:hypothetical protein B0A80_17675 [Flavobacterium tructae]|uniref:glycosyltransferase n=1 Tax=Flavobacterium tructae TaxID=1114873 RepID=UPI000B5B8587|nr:glycosyltransferase [Flavobacterium tructae]OXB20757.1 hypothetical protein B0A80_17675 [Flavobacterium tructae]
MINLYFVGRFIVRQKRIDRLLELSKLLDLDNCDYSFKIFSDVDFNSNEYKEFENNKKFNFLGFKNNWVDYIDEKSIMIFVSDYEGCPLSILEAYKNNHKKIAILEMPGVENYVSENSICKSIEQMAEKINKNCDLENLLDLSSYFDKVRFARDVERLYKTI